MFEILLPGERSEDSPRAFMMRLVFYQRVVELTELQRYNFAELGLIFVSVLKQETAMLGESHDIFHEFPEYKDRIEDLRLNDPEFFRLMSKHDELDQQIRGLEIANQPVADEFMEDLKKQRIFLKDQLYDLLRHHIK